MLWLSIVSCFLIPLCACQSLPDTPHTEQSITLDHKLLQVYQDPNTQDNLLSTAITEQSRHHPTLSGYHPILTGADAFAARSILTDMATHSIDVQYYIWHDDQSGQLLLKDLWEAADRGVIVRFLLDDFNSSLKLDQQLLRFSSHPNIAVRLVNPLVYRRLQMINYLTDLRRINHRMHNKSMTFDRQLSIIGGRNIGNEYLSNDKESQFADLDMLLIGQVVKDINHSFDEYWSSPLSFDINTLVQPKNNQTTLKVLEYPSQPISNAQRTAQFLAGLDKVDINESKDSRSLSIYKKAIEDSKIDADLINKNIPFRWATMQFVSDNVHKLTNSASPDTYLVNQLRYLLGKPNEKLTLISSYFVPTKEGVEALIRLSKVGVKVKILTNSFDATDVTAVHSGYAEWRRDLLAAGVELYELKATVAEEDRDNKLWRARSQSSTSLHAKTFAVDSHHVFVGSYNVDPRSANINTELGVIINDDELAAQLHAAVDEHLMTQAYKVILGEHGNLQWQTIENGQMVTYTSEPNVDLSDKIWIKVMSWLPIDWLL
ncbi:phospholipase D family protein [Psychrobacter sp. I-STPA6b]|uniref:phospholipase D family protein n=1 Tax=Psychrobacter sp. I-STPA6b TaxID=2585718 RepID=UPI001D0CBF62|nr:phospholipase D family protein [Psychrobacter sp. I-STPA6b]